MVHRRGGQSRLGLAMLGAQLLHFGLENIPPATLALIAGQSAIFMDVFPKYFPSAHGVCVSSYLVYHHSDWRRLILSTFYHAHDMHLYFNMISLLYKGTMLERKFGTPYFIYLTGVFTTLCSLGYVGLGLLLRCMLEDESYAMSCAVGFSGVLFAMKVLTTHYTPAGTQYLMGILPVPSKYVFWAELVLIQLVTPNASFVGHLAGILVGLLYVKGPLRHFMNSFFPPGSDGRGGGSSLFPPGFFRRAPGMYRAPNFRATPSAPYPDADSRAMPSAPYPPDNQGFHPHSYGPSQPQSPPSERFQNAGSWGNFPHLTGGIDEDEQYRLAMEESLRNHPHQSNSQRMYPDLDDLRARRTHFYQ